MGAFDRILTRAAGYGSATKSSWKPRLGNLKGNTATGRRGKGVTAATKAVTWISEGQPLQIDWDTEGAIEDYLGHVWVMRGCQVIAQTIAELPWVAGMDPTAPGSYTPAAPLAKFLGPATPQAPGGPNPSTSSRIFWNWSIIQYIVTGRFAWETQLTGSGKNVPVVALYPLVSNILYPKPTNGGGRWFTGYQYQPPTGRLTLTNDQVVYCWRPSIRTWRQPESVLEAARLPIFIARSIDKYTANLLNRDMVATTMVITPPFDEAGARRAWQEQFLAEYTGLDRVGATIFGEFEPGTTTGAGVKPSVQVERIATTPRTAQMDVMATTAKQDISIATGVPKSILGDASARTYTNASVEYKNFWTVTVMPLINELQDHVNNALAPRVGTEVGWFDLSRVEALKPPSVFMPPTVTSVIATGVATPQQVQNILNLPAMTPQSALDTTTAPLDTESQGGGGMGGGGGGMMHDPRMTLRGDAIINRAAHLTLERRSIVHGWLREAAFRKGQRWEEWPDHVNTWTLKGLHKRAVDDAKPLVIYTQPKPVPKPEPAALQTLVEAISWRSEDGPGIEAGARIAQRAQELRALAVVNRTTKKVHDYLGTNYPERTLSWVDTGEWSGPRTVPLSTIDMGRRPGGRTQAKVQGIAKALTSDPDGPAGVPVILVQTPAGGKLEVADGYHRLLAHQRLGHMKVSAFVGKVDSTSGPWEKDMHDAKQNRADTDTLTQPDTTPSVKGATPATTVETLTSDLAQVDLPWLETFADALSEELETMENAA